MTLNSKSWKQGTQDGFIFSDSIARNIAVGEEIIDTPRLMTATAEIITADKRLLERFVAVLNQGFTK